MPNKTKLNIAAVQSDITWLDSSKNCSDLDRKLKDIEADIIVLPETFSSGFAFSNDDCGEIESGLTFKWMQCLAKRKSAAVIGSIAIRLDSAKVNRCYFVYPDGKFEHYDKRHLFRMAGEDKFVTAGTERKVIQYLGWNILLQVCYDLRFPVWSRNKNDYDVLINIANWPAARRDPWDILLKARAIENLCYVVGVNRVGSDGNNIGHCGGTVIVNYKGEPLKEATNNTEDIIQACIELEQLQRFRQQFPAHLDADEFTIKI